MLVRQNLTERAKDFYIILDDVSIVSLYYDGCYDNLIFYQTDLSFGREYTAAVEAKQVGMFHVVRVHQYNNIFLQHNKRHKELNLQWKRQNKKDKKKL